MTKIGIGISFVLNGFGLVRVVFRSRSHEDGELLFILVLNSVDF